MKYWPQSGPSETPIPEDLLDKFGLYEQYAAASYCPRNFEAQPDKRLKCPVGNCPRVQNAETSIVYSFTRLVSLVPITASWSPHFVPTQLNVLGSHSSPLTDTSGYVAFDHTHRLIIVAFRGSESFRNYLTFLDFPLIPIDFCTGCLSAKGYWTAWLEVRDDILKAVKETHEEYPGYKVVSTGHSLGGAIATLAVGKLRDQGHVVDLVNNSPSFLWYPRNNWWLMKWIGLFRRPSHRKLNPRRLPNFSHSSERSELSRRARWRSDVFFPIGFRRIPSS
jgi:Lipase (class 3)/Lipase 3 N-terminal region